MFVYIFPTKEAQERMRKRAIKVIPNNFISLNRLQWFLVMSQKYADQTNKAFIVAFIECVVVLPKWIIRIYINWLLLFNCIFTSIFGCLISVLLSYMRYKVNNCMNKFLTTIIKYVFALSNKIEIKDTYNTDRIN